jgi:hypothetical protein
MGHKQQVQRLYRRSLYLLNSWAVDRDIFNSEALAIRAAFDANASLDANSM